MIAIPEFPDSVPVSFDMSEELIEIFKTLPDGISEFSFSGLYLFRKRYNYRLSMNRGTLIIFGEREGRKFFMTPAGLPEPEVLFSLLETCSLWKLIPVSVVDKGRDFFSLLEREKGLSIQEDRNNFDYLYHRRELADLPGKAFHKKKNRVNAFTSAYPHLTSEPLSRENIRAAREVLDAWAEGQENPLSTDYNSAVEALSLVGDFGLKGFLVYAGDKPAAWCISEFMVQGTMAVVHFEKARIDMPGAFQYINYAFARSLSESVLFINREQDLGDEGMRQAKMTYRPCGFVKKFKIESR